MVSNQSRRTVNTTEASADSQLTLQGHRHTSTVYTTSPNKQLIRWAPTCLEGHRQHRSKRRLTADSRTPSGTCPVHHNDTIHRFETQTHNKQQSDVLQPVYKDTDALQTCTQANVYKSQQTTHLMVSNQSRRTQTAPQT
jgi:hypothetical protein